MAKRRKKKSSVFELIVLILIIGYTIYLNMSKPTEASVIKETTNNTVTENLEVHFIDVGQADSILIRSKDENMLIDAGNNEDGKLLVEYLKSIGVSSFKYLVGTHAHEDHIGGMDDIIDSFEVGKYYMPDVLTTTKTFENVLDSLAKKGYKYYTPKIGETFELGEAKFEVIYVGTDSKDLNSTSVVLRMDHGNNSFLLTGDATSEVEKSILDKNIDVDVLKVAHHGSPYSSTSAFLNKVTPKYAVIQVGLNNTYNHPSETIIKRLEKLNAKIYRTDQNGTIIMESNGNDIDIKTLETKTNG